MGIPMKTCVILSCIVCASFAAAAPPNRQLLQSHGWQWEVTVDVFEGTLEGFFSGFKDLKACANDTVSAYDDINNAVSLIKQQTPASVLQGIKSLGAALNALKEGLVDCKAAYGEIQSFVKAFEQFSNPGTFAFHVGKDLLVNGKDIYQEITQAVSLWNSQSYLDCGQQIGKALYKLVVGDKWKHYAVHASFPADAPSPKSKCALKCTAEAIGVYWACAAVCIKKQAPNSCVLDGCPAAVTAFDVPCLSSCKNSTVAVNQTSGGHLLQPELCFAKCNTGNDCGGVCGHCDQSGGVHSHGY